MLRIKSISEAIPAAAAHHNGGAPSIVSPSKVTDPGCSTLAKQRSTKYSTTSWCPFLQERTKGVAPLVLAATSLHIFFLRQVVKEDLKIIAISTSIYEQ